jgi:acyl-CoA thioester hydrolase
VGHVNNIVYLQWLENVRVKLLEEVGLPVADLTEKHRVFPVLRNTEIQYKKPYFLNNDVKIEVWISQLKNASFDLQFKLTNEKNELCSTASQTCLFIDRETMRPIRFPKEFRKTFENYLVTNPE